MTLTYPCCGIVRSQGMDPVGAAPAGRVDAAMEAVKQWRYQPTLLNGVPVEIITAIQVDFVLA